MIQEAEEDEDEDEEESGDDDGLVAPRGLDAAMDAEVTNQLSTKNYLTINAVIMLCSFYLFHFILI